MTFFDLYDANSITLAMLNNHIFELDTTDSCRKFIKKLVKLGKPKTLILRVHSRYNRLRASEERKYILDDNMQALLKRI